MSGNKFSEAVQTQVRLRSQGLCEYCHALERWQYVQFTVDHVIPFIWSSDGLMIVGLTATDC